MALRYCAVTEQISYIDFLHVREQILPTRYHQSINTAETVGSSDVRQPGLSNIASFCLCAITNISGNESHPIVDYCTIGPSREVLGRFPRGINSHKYEATTRNCFGRTTNVQD